MTKRTYHVWFIREEECLILESVLTVDTEPAIGALARVPVYTVVEAHAVIPARSGRARIYTYKKYYICSFTEKCQFKIAHCDYCVCCWLQNYKHWNDFTKLFTNLTYFPSEPWRTKTPRSTNEVNTRASIDTRMNEAFVDVWKLLLTLVIRLRRRSPVA